MTRRFDLAVLPIQTNIHTHVTETHTHIAANARGYMVSIERRHKVYEVIVSTPWVRICTQRQTTTIGYIYNHTHKL